MHGFGMEEALDIAGIDAAGRVLSTRRLQPGRVARLTGAAWVLEVPAGEPLPPAGSMLQIGVSP